MNEDLVLIMVAFAIIVAVPYDLYVAREIVSGALIKPRIPFLTAIAAITSCIAGSAVLAALIAINGVVFLASDSQIRLLPSGAGTFLLAICLLGFSAGNVPLLRLLRQWARERRAHLHRRDGETPQFHRRHDDPPPGGRS